ncbi:MAG: hypothetical protein ABIR32_21345 [Ilumatobacteraceae bacterium]
MSQRPFDFAGIAEFASQRLAMIAERARTLAKGVTAFAAVGGVLAYAVGLFAFPPSSRLFWSIIGIIVCGAPLLAALVALRRLRRVRATVSQTASELRSVMNDKAMVAALTELVDRDEASVGTTPLVKLGTELNVLRKVSTPHREALTSAWQSITALTSLPGLAALAIVGTIALFAFSAIAVMARLLLGT